MPSIIVLTVFRNGRVAATEACLAKNERKTISGRFPSRFEELKAIYADDKRYHVERKVQSEWPDWATRR